jgi:phage-related protein
MSGASPWVLLACFGGLGGFVLLAAVCRWAYRRLRDEYNSNTDRDSNRNSDSNTDAQG